MYIIKLKGSIALLAVLAGLVSLISPWHQINTILFEHVEPIESVAHALNTVNVSYSGPVQHLGTPPVTSAMDSTFEEEKMSPIHFVHHDWAKITV